MEITLEKIRFSGKEQRGCKRNIKRINLSNLLNLEKGNIKIFYFIDLRASIDSPTGDGYVDLGSKLYILIKQEEKTLLKGYEEFNRDTLNLSSRDQALDYLERIKKLFKRF